MRRRRAWRGGRRLHRRAGRRSRPPACPETNRGVQRQAARAASLAPIRSIGLRLACAACACLHAALPDRPLAVASDSTSARDWPFPAATGFRGRSASTRSASATRRPRRDRSRDDGARGVAARARSGAAGAGRRGRCRGSTRAPAPGALGGRTARSRSPAPCVVGTAASRVAPRSIRAGRSSSAQAAPSGR